MSDLADKIREQADELNQCLQIIVTNAGNILDDLHEMKNEGVGSAIPDAVREIESAVARASKVTWGGREVVLGLVEADVPEGAISLTVRGYEQVACVMEALRKAGYVSARGAAAERQMKRGSG